MQGGVETIKPYVDEFIDFAHQHTELQFYVTRIGCGIAGFRDKDIALYSTKAIELPNIILPKSFVKLLTINKILKDYSELCTIKISIFSELAASV